MSEVYRIVFQAIAGIGFSAGIALFVNEAREDRLPLIMPFSPEYRCPQGLDAAPPVSTVKALGSFGRSDTVFVDARSEEEFTKGHIEGCINIPYLFVEPTSNEVLLRLRPYKTIIIYCNSRNAQLSRLMAADLSQSEVRGVGYLEEGFLGWVMAGGKYTGQRPQGYEELR